MEELPCHPNKPLICTIKGEEIPGKLWRFSVQQWSYSLTHRMSQQGVYYTQYFPICYVHSCRKKLVPSVNVALIFGGCFYLKKQRDRVLSCCKRCWTVIHLESAQWAVTKQQFSKRNQNIYKTQWVQTFVLYYIY